MIIGFDAKRMFCNQRGLGNYSRDLIRILSEYYPENTYHLYTPQIKVNVETNSLKTTIHKPHGIFSALPHSFWRTYRIKNEILKNGDQIFHGLSQELPAGLQKTNVKKIITFHDAIFVRFPELYDPFYRRIITLKTKHACRYADKIIAISEQSKRDAIQYFDADEKKVEVIYQGCNNIFRQKISTDVKEYIRRKYSLPEQFLLYVGAIEKRKNIETLLRAISILNFDITLVIVGRETNYSKVIRQLTTNLNLTEKVIYLQNTSTNELPAIYQLSKIFIFPSIFEGFGIPILEALSSGTPVISSKGSCFEETGGANSVYFDSKNHNELADAIQKILANESLQKKMITEGYKYAENFTDERIAEKLNYLYKSIL